MKEKSTLRMTMHLNRRIQPLPQLETEHMQVMNRIGMESSTDQERTLRELFRVFQWKYKIDPAEPWWRRWYFYLIWLPFSRFSCLKVGMVAFERIEPDGSVSWKEDQGFFTQEWQAAQEAAKYPYGGYACVSVNSCESPMTCHSRSLFPNSKAQRRYRKRSKLAIDVGAVERLNQALIETQQFVDNHRQRHQSRP